MTDKQTGQTNRQRQIDRTNKQAGQTYTHTDIINTKLSCLCNVDKNKYPRKINYSTV